MRAARGCRGNRAGQLTCCGRRLMPTLLRFDVAYVTLFKVRRGCLPAAVLADWRIPASATFAPFAMATHTSTATSAASTGPCLPFRTGPTLSTLSGCVAAVPCHAAR